MKQALALTILLVFVVVSPFSAIAQDEEHAEHHSKAEKPATPSASADAEGEAVDAKCQMMAQKMELMKAQMAALDAQLNLKLVEMKQSTGDDAIANIKDVVASLVEIHRKTREMQAEKEAMMMTHMAEHMAKPDGMKSMMNCPMMQQSDEEHGSKAEHEQHSILEP